MGKPDAADPEILVEQTLLGGLLIAPERIDDVSDIVREEDFRLGMHRQLWSGLLEMVAQREPVDFVTVVAHMVRRGGAREQWTKLVADLAQSTTTSAHVSHHARTIADRATLGAIAKVCGEAISEAREVTPGLPDSVEAFVEHVESGVFNAAHRRLNGAKVTAPEPILRELMIALQSREHLGLATGIAELDNVLLGIRPGEFMVIASRPSVGKTALGMQVALNIASQQASVFYASIEMTSVELMERAVVNFSGVDSYKVRRRTLHEEDMEQIRDAAANLSRLRFGFTDDPHLTVARLRSLARRWSVQAGGLDLIVVDYLQLMTDPTAKAGDRVQEISNISRGLKVMGKELGVPVIALSQLSRKGDEGVPKLSHLRDSGSIEQDADQVVLLWFDTTGNMSIRKCGIAKNRHGRTDEVDLAFHGSTYRFAGTVEPDNPWAPAPVKTEAFNFDDQGNERAKRADWD